MSEPTSAFGDAAPPVSGGSVATLGRHRPRRARRTVAPERNTAYPDTRFGLARYTRLVQTGSALLAVLGGWLVVAPWLVGFSAASPVTVDSVAAGLVLVAVALMRVAAPLHLAGSAWLTFVLGVWVVCSGFVLGYPRGFDRLGAYWTMVASGTLVIAVAIWSTVVADRLALRARPVTRRHRSAGAGTAAT